VELKSAPLLETSVLTRLRQPDVYRAVVGLTENWTVSRCVISDLEIGFSVRNAGEWDLLNRAVRVYSPVLVLPQDYARACGIQRALAESGLKGRKIPDLLIAAAAERENLTLLHCDRDFDLIAEITGQSCEWVVQRGSID
jgi:predicted nucleic acid-binding protein